MRSGGWGTHPRLRVHWLAPRMPWRKRARKQASSGHTSRLAGGLLTQHASTILHVQLAGLRSAGASLKTKKVSTSGSASQQQTHSSSCTVLA